MGRFYYRRPTGESGADVYDRAATFWDSLLSLALNPKDMFLPASQMPKTDDALLVVTHGLHNALAAHALLLLVGANHGRRLQSRKLR